MQKLSARVPDAKLLIAGHGPDREKLESYAKDLGLRNVEFLGFISQEEKLQLLKQARVFCSPALYGESFGIVLLEAMACGTPVIAGNNPGYSAVLKDQAKISLVNPKKADLFAAHLEYLLTDDEAHAKWRNWALEYVKQFNYTNVIDAYEELYKGLHKSV
jgi:phosphatidylinositol alpha-mannosyltransferase